MLSPRWDACKRIDGVLYECALAATRRPRDVRNDKDMQLAVQHFLEREVWKNKVSRDRVLEFRRVLHRDFRLRTPLQIKVRIVCVTCDVSHHVIVHGAVAHVADVQHSC